MVRIYMLLAQKLYDCDLYLVLHSRKIPLVAIVLIDSPCPKSLTRNKCKRASVDMSAMNRVITKTVQVTTCFRPRHGQHIRSLDLSFFLYCSSTFLLRQGTHLSKQVNMLLLLLLLLPLLLAAQAPVLFGFSDASTSLQPQCQSKTATQIRHRARNAETRMD